MIQRWQHFLDSLETPGGNVLILLFLTVLTYIMVFFNLPKAVDCFYMAFGALLGILSPKRSA